MASTHDAAIIAQLRRAALACRILAMENHDDKTLGHLSWRDPEGRGFWLKRSRISLAEVENESDFVLMSFDGHKLQGPGDVHLEWPIHAEILRARPDVPVVAHTHARHATIYAALDEPLHAITNEVCLLRERIARYRGYSGLIDTKALGQELAASLGIAWAVFQQNHGVTFVGRSIAHAVMNGIYLEISCEQMLSILASGRKFTVTPDEDARRKADAVPDSYNDQFFEFYIRKLARRERT